MWVGRDGEALSVWEENQHEKTYNGGRNVDIRGRGGEGERGGGGGGEERKREGLRRMKKTEEGMES